MVRLGKVYGNLMVDLRATNSKLYARAERLVQVLAGTDAATARELLAASALHVPTATLMHRAGLTADEAREVLSRASGSLRAALALVGTSTPAGRGPRDGAGRLDHSEAAERLELT